MNRNLLIASLAVIAGLGLTTVSGQWGVYSGNVLPQDGDGLWYEGSGVVDPPDDLTDFLVMVADPDIEGNMLVKVDGVISNWGYQETWKHPLGGNSNVGHTLVWRAMGLDTSVYVREFDIYMYNGTVRERIITRNQAIKFDKAGVEVVNDITVWHVYRLTALADQINLYIDEDPIAWMTVTGQPATESPFFQFGDNGGDLYGALYDWFIWDSTGAYAPGEGTAFPDTLTGISQFLAVDDLDQTPRDFSLSQNYPNPFNPSTVIGYKIGAAAMVSLKVYDITGQLITTLVNSEQQPGAYKVEWDGRHTNANGDMAASGVYFYAMQVGDQQFTRKMLLLK